MTYRYEITCKDLEIQYDGAGPWRCFELTTFGDTYDDLISNSAIAEVDAEDLEIGAYSVARASAEVATAAKRLISEFIDKRDRDLAEALASYKVNREIAIAKEGY